MKQNWSLSSVSLASNMEISSCLDSKAKAYWCGWWNPFCRLLSSITTPIEFIIMSSSSSLGGVTRNEMMAQFVTLRFVPQLCEFKLIKFVTYITYTRQKCMHAPLASAPALAPRCRRAFRFVIMFHCVQAPYRTETETEMSLMGAGFVVVDGRCAAA